ncbi:glycosyltransferase family 4 protein [Saccharolobus sp.]|uniref:glycosyltransferase family 4 protein n=2 Tax=Saccharolobus sp. TaxID=2100761 RepID=UPI0031622353
MTAKPHKRTRILVIAPNFRVGSGPSNSLLFIKYLPTESIIFYTSEERASYFANSKNDKLIHTTSLRGLTHYRLSRILRDLADRLSFDYVITIAPEYLIFLPPKMLKKTLAIPQGFPEIPHVKMEFKNLLNVGYHISLLETYRVSKNVGAMGAISKYMYDEISRRLRPKRIALLYNPVREEFFANSKTLDRGVEKLRLLYVGVLKRLKGVDKLISFMPDVLREFPNTRLDIIGEGPLRSALEEEVRRLKLDKYVKIHGRVEEDALLRFYREATILVTASNWEGFCLPVAEAAAMGIPSVVRAVYALKEHVELGYAEGFNKDDPYEFLMALGRVLDNYEKLSERGREVARLLYYPYKVAQRIMAVLKELN